MDFGEFFTSNEASLRLGFFFGSFLLFVTIELIKPFRQFKESRSSRWTSNLILTFGNTLLLRLIFPASAVGFALLAERQGFGFFHWVEAPYLVALVASLLLLDMGIYFQHRIFHRVPVLWRLHRVHHSDPGFDITTGARFHPIEILLSMGVKFLMIMAIGASAESVILFEIILSTSANFNHTNMSLPAVLEKPIRWILVTPDMHRIHHSQVVRETDSNFAFCFSFWDRIFGTYVAEPKKGQDGLDIGLKEYPGKEGVNLLKLLKNPFT